MNYYFSKKITGYFVLVIIISGSLLSQNKEGWLQRIDINDAKINLNDTLGYWCDANIGYNRHYKKYNTAFNLDTQFLKGRETIIEWDGTTTFVDGLMILLNAGTGEELIYANYSNFIIGYGERDWYKTSHGIWFTAVNFFTSFLSNDGHFFDPVGIYKDDILYEETEFIPYIIGEIDQKLIVLDQVGSLDDKDTYKFANIEYFDGSEDSEFQRGVRVKFDSTEVNFSSGSPETIEHIKDSLYAVSFVGSTDLYIYSYDKDNQCFKQLNWICGDVEEWKIKDDELFIESTNNIFKLTFNESDSSFSNPDTLCKITSNDYSIYEFESVAYVEDSTLILFDLNSKSITQTWDISGLNNTQGVILCPPNIYLHVETDIINSIEKKELSEPETFSLTQNYPNPFNPATTIQYQVPSKEYIVLKIFNTLGQEVATLVNKQQPAGTYKVTFDASQLPSGVYLYRLKAGDYSQTKKMVYLR